MSDEPEVEPEAEPEPQAAPDFDLDEDLFSFDEIIAVAEGEEDKIDLEELLQVLNAEEPEPEPVEPEELDEEVIGQSPEDLTDEGAEIESKAPTPEFITVAAPASPPTRSVKVALGMVVAASIINLAFFGVVWKSDSGVGETLQSIESRFLNRVIDIEQSLLSTAEAQAMSIQPYVAPETGPHSGVIHARKLISSGDYPEARRRCYSILAILDRFGDAEREEIEAQCTFLLADSYRREAEDYEAAAQ